jgi:hypothetical protein
MTIKAKSKITSVIIIIIMSGTTALTGACRRSYGSIAEGNAFEEQVANLLLQHSFESA